MAGGLAWPIDFLASRLNLLAAEIAALASEFGAADKLFPKGTSNMFASLARSIAGQQLATQAAFKIHGRFVEVCKVGTLTICLLLIKAHKS